MSLDSSLKTQGNLTQHRNVLKRHERIERLKEQGKFNANKDTAVGLPKVGNRKAAIGKKTVKKEDEK
ncbi:MAG: small basic protein [Phycisphaerales bacterium]